jgi:uncharacterized repeat protein (TIGR03803 family)
LYGVTLQGGRYDKGTVFKLAPPVAPSTTWTKTTLHDFAGAPADGRRPVASLAMHRGTLCGTTYYGGSEDSGTVFRLLPPSDGGDWRYEILFNFKHGTDGFAPYSRLSIDDNGVVYGFTIDDDTRGPSSGTFFKLTPAAGASWLHEVIHKFTDADDGTVKVNLGSGIPILDEDGAVLTTSFSGGSSDGGTIFKFAPGDTEPTILYNFGNSDFDGSWPDAGIVRSVSGTLYGTTISGGNNGYGTVFLLSPPLAPSTTWTETKIYDLPANPWSTILTLPNGVVLSGHGELFGAVTHGGTRGFGFVYRLTPPEAGHTAWTSIIMHNFRGAGDGANPGTLMRRGNVLYGVTSSGGGACDCGTIYKIEY